MICPSSAESIHRFNPEAKILVVLRNPIRRAWSQFLMNLREAKSDADNFIQELEHDHSQNPKGWGVNHQYLELGKYTQQLKRYLDLFGKDRVLPIFFEDYKNNPEEILSSACRFLKIDDTFQFDFSEKSNASALPRNAGLNRFLVNSGILSTAKKLIPKPLRQKFSAALYSDKNMPTLQEADAKWLCSYYQDDVGQLSELLGKDITQKWPEFGKSYE